MNSLVVCRRSVWDKIARKLAQRANYSSTTQPRTLFDKIFESHIVDKGDESVLIYVDRHLVHEVTSPQAFEGLRNAGRQVRRPNYTLAVADHNVPTSDRSKGIADEESRIQIETLEKNTADFGVQYFKMDDIRQGIVHIVGPEQGFTQPGMIIVCGDSHTATHGAFGALAFGIGTSEVEHVLATQTLLQKKPKNMRITTLGDLPLGVTSKDLVMHIIGVIGTAGGTGHVIEYAGEAIRKLSMEGRMTVCNMSIEAGARAGMIAPDDITFEYLKGRPMAPTGANWEKALAYWKTLPSDEGAAYDTEVEVKAADIAPQVTWGTSPQDVCAITEVVPDPKNATDANQAAAITRALDYMGLKAGTKMEDVSVDKVFIGSCTNGRIEDLREVAAVAKGHKVSSSVHAMIVPGSGLVKKQAEAEGLDAIFKEAGFDWREPGCSMCLAMNADRLKPQERCASTSNRNFEGRQGRGGRTHLVSPAMAAAAAIKGRLADVRQFGLAKRAFSTRYSGRRHFSTSRRTGMQAFTKLAGIAAPLPIMNVDTDLIIPKLFLKTIKRTGLGKNLFDEVRYTPDGAENPEFVLNKDPWRSSQILISGENFGCGSSREHAPWALLDFGIRVVVAPSFADIFFNNCFKNGILPIVLPQEQVDSLMEDAAQGSELSVDLVSQTILRPNGEAVPFSVDEFRKHCLLNGLDDIGLTLQKADQIASFEEKRAVAMPWL